MINKILTIAIFSLVSLTTTAQQQISLESKVTLELPSAAEKYIDTAMANDFSKIGNLKVPAYKMPLIRYTYKVGSAKYRFYPPQKAVDRPSSAKIPNLGDATAKHISIPYKEVNGNILIGKISEMVSRSIYQFVCYNEKRKLSFRAFITFPTGEKDKTLRDINTILESINFRN